MPAVGPAVPRLPFGPDPLRRIRVPRDLESVTTRAAEADAADAGMEAGHVERIWEAAEAVYRTGLHPAVALCVRREGHVVLDRAIGHARGNGPDDPPDAPRELARPSTPFVIFSASKAFTAMVVHLLDQRGELHTDDRVVDYIPEFHSHGKHRITIEHVLSHRAGVPSLPSETLDLDRVDDREFLLDALYAARPRTRPGRLLAYHAISGGFILAEVVRRVTGRGIAAVLAEEILEPLGFRWSTFGVAPEDVDRVGRSAPTGAPVLPPLSTALTWALGKHPDDIARLGNDPRFLTGVIPSANTVTTANEFSRFFELLRRGGELDGVRIFDPRTIRRATAERAYREFDLTLGAPLRHSTGFMLGAKVLSLFGPDTEEAFGHLGFTNVLGWADSARGLSVGLITSGKPIVQHGLADLWELTRRIGEAAPELPPEERPLRR